MPARLCSLDGLEQVSEDAALVASLAVSHVFGSRHVINQHHAAQQAALQHNQQHMIIQQNNRRMANMLLSRPALAEVVHELVQSPPTEDELRRVRIGVQKKFWATYARFP